MYDSSSSNHFYNDRAEDFCERMEDIKARASFTADDYSCSSSSSSSSYGGQTNIQQSSASAASEADGYAGQSSGGVGVVSDMARTFQWWMAGVAAAVIMALVAIVMGQRKDRRDSDNGSGGGVGGQQDRAVLSGAVGRRLGAVAAFAEGVLPTRNKNNRNKEQVTEMSGYKLDTTSDGGGSIHSGGSDEENGSLGGYESAYA